MENKYENFIKFHKPTCDNDVDSLIDLLDGSVILDIGSNIGLFSESIVQKCNYKKIFMFEPVSDFFNYSKNLLYNKENIIFNNFALGDYETEMEISINLDMNIGSTSLNRTHINEKRENIHIKTLDSLKIKDKIDFIKIDVEGFEANVIMGGLNTIKKNMPIIFTEVSFPILDEHKKVFKELFNLGYQEFDLNKEDAINDILILPKGFLRKKNLNKSDITFVMVSKGVLDFFSKTLDSFFKINTYPIEKYIIITDSKNIQFIKDISKKYNNLEIISIENKNKLNSIDQAYSLVETDYIFHCEEGYEFYKDGFIENSIKVLKTQQKVIQVYIKSDNNNPIQDKIYYLPLNVGVSIIEPINIDVGQQNYMGFNFCPGVKRLKDWKILPNGYSQFISEYQIDQYYRTNKFMIVSLATKINDGYVKFIK
jgi:FkbM family methyltransferase